MCNLCETINITLTNSINDYIIITIFYKKGNLLKYFTINIRSVVL